MRTAALVFCLIMLGLALLRNIIVGSSTVKDSRSSIIAGVLSVLMMASVIYLYAGEGS